MRDKFASQPVWFLFGLSGAGKSFVGDLIAQDTGWPVYHADADISEDMRLALAQNRPFTDAMRQAFFAQLPNHIAAHQQPGLPLIVTQGAYKQKHRDFLQARVPGLVPVWVDAPRGLIAQRIQQRAEGIQTDSAEALVRDFEAPPGDSCRILNDGDKNTIRQQWQRCVERFR